MKKIIIYLTCIILFGSCSSKIALKPNYYQSTSRIGLLVVTEADAKEYSGSSYGGGLVGAIISTSLVPKMSKYDSVILKRAPSLDPKIKIEQLYQEIFSQKGKPLIVLNEKFDIDDYKKFQTSDTSKKYFDKDLRSLKLEYGLDELFLVKVNYGMSIKYSYGIETGRYAKIIVVPTIVNLSDNSLLYRDKIYNALGIKGEWNTPPDYTLIKTAVNKVIEISINLQKERFK